MTCGTLHIPIILPGLNKTIALKHPSSVLSIFISRIFATSSVRTRSNMVPTPAWWALLLCTWRPVASSIPSLTTIDRCEKPAISSSFQPKERINAIQQEFSPSAYNTNQSNTERVISLCPPLQTVLLLELFVYPTIDWVTDHGHCIMSMTYLLAVEWPDLPKATRWSEVCVWPIPPM